MAAPLGPEQRGRVLVVDDRRGMCEVLAEGLTRRGFEVAWRTDPALVLPLLESDPFDVVVTDLNMPGVTGLELCDRIVANRPDLPVILITAFASLESAIGAIRAGAYDFVTKPLRVDALAVAVDRAVQHRRLRDEVRRLRSLVAETTRFEDMLGQSAPMRALYDLLGRVAASDVTVLITGETGTGKELVARGIHARSRRRNGPYVAINCAAMPETLLESELFGHARGAFTDARTARVGLFLRANGGTLFLDEIGDMPAGIQAKLLRALQERVVRPVGADADVPFDARIVAATHRDLQGAVEAGTFREDLYFRVNVVQVELPPLRARGADVLLLAQTLLERAAARSSKAVTGISQGAARRLLEYAWPGNVRELQNCIERAVALTRFEEIAVEDLPERIRTYQPSHVVVAADDPTELVPLDEVERRYILRVLDAVGGNKRQAARVLGVDRRTLYRRLERYGVPTDDDDA